MAAAASLSSIIGDGGLTLVGCGKMGGALLAGWLRGGAPADRIMIADPAPSEETAGPARAAGARIAPSLAELNLGKPPSILVMAVKPQRMAEALPAATQAMSGQTLLISIAAGTPISAFEAVAPAGAPIIRAMPNTPAAVGAGVSAIIGNAHAGAAALEAAEALLGVVGSVVRLAHEDQIDAVTGLSGSGPAYVFHMIEALAAAGEAEGLAPELATALARATVIGAGALAADSPKPASELRVDVTSPGGVTQAGLGALMAEADGLTALMRRTLKSAAARSRELRE